MKILVDTCIWSEVLRRKNPNGDLTRIMRDFIADGRVVIIGPIRHELLSGVKNPEQFNKLKELISPFKDVSLETEHFLKAAEFANICRSKGVQGSTIDFLICAVAHLGNFAIFSTDKNFENFKKQLPIKIITP